MEHIHDSRRIYTDGRAWPAFIEPSFNGYSIGKWVDDGNTGQYNVLEVESRGFKGPRAYDNTGLPLPPRQPKASSRNGSTSTRPIAPS